MMPVYPEYPKPDFRAYKLSKFVHMCVMTGMMRDENRHLLFNACFDFIPRYIKGDKVLLRHVLFIFPLYAEACDIITDPFTSHLKYYAETFMLSEPISTDVKAYLDADMLEELTTLFPEFKHRLPSYLDTPVPPQTNYRFGSSTPIALEDMMKDRDGGRE